MVVERPTDMMWRLGVTFVAFGIAAGDAHDARRALVRAAARLTEKRNRKREGGDGDGDCASFSRWLAAAMARGCAILGALALCAAPLVLLEGGWLKAFVLLLSGLGAAAKLLARPFTAVLRIAPR